VARPSITQLGMGEAASGRPVCCQDGSSAAEPGSDEDIGPLLTACWSLLVMVRRVRPGKTD
jgi:hypothetical protein